MKTRHRFALAMMICLALLLVLAPGVFAAEEQAGVSVRFINEKGYDLIGFKVLDADGNAVEPVETGDVYGYLLLPGEYRAVYHDDLDIFPDYEDSFFVGDEPQEIPLSFNAFSEHRMDGQVFVNPFYADEFDEDDLAFHEQALQAEFDRVADRLIAENAGSSGGLSIDYSTAFQSPEDEIEAGAITLRNALRQRQDSVSVIVYTGKTVWTPDDFYDAVDTIYNGALRHTGDQCEGDTLAWERKSWECSGSYNKYDNNRGSYYHVIAFSTIYQSNAAQEAQTAAKVNELVSTLGLRSKSDYDKILSIHQYLYENVDYDHTYSRHSSYHTLIEHNSVCQGFATAVYRLCLAAGLDARVVSSVTMNHGWDIVNLNGRWYYLDSTWDSNRMEPYKKNGRPAPDGWLPYYFLRGSDWWLINHTDDSGISELGDEFDETRNSYDPLFASYVISGTDYDPATATYRIAYDANGGKGIPEDQIKIHGIDLTLSSTKPTRASSSAGSYTVTLNANGGSVSPASLSAARPTSYTFKNWNTAANGSGKSYAPGATYSTDENVTLYAQWNSSTKTAAVTLPTPTRSGYVFKGWGTSSTSTSGVTGSYTPTGNVTLYAVWEKKPTPEAASGTWGDLSWTLDADGLLTISGSGSMKDLYTLDGKRVAWGSKASQIRKVVIGNGITRIGNEAFYNCDALESISIPDSVESIGKYAFYNCNSLSNLVIPNSVKRFDDYAFCQCGGLRNLELSSNVTSIGKYAFARCGYLTRASLPASIGSINDGIFCECTSLNSFSIPEGITSIGNSAFANCISLQDITIPSSVQSIGTAALYGCTGLTRLTIQAKITSIDQSAFQHLTALVDVTLPDGIEKIGKWAFSGCSSLKRIVIPASVTSIEYGAFLQCNSLTDVYYGGTQNQWNKIIVEDCNHPLNNAIIHYAGESQTPYTVTYDANGGKGIPEDQIKIHGIDLTLSSTKPTRASSSAGSYTVTLNANGGSVSPASLSAARPTSYTFKNWNTAANGSGKSYAPGATYSTDENVTLYAQWNSSTKTAAVTLPTPTRSGYVFKGWGTSSTSTSGVTGSYTPTGNVTLYAVWEKKPTPEVTSGTWGNLSWTLDGNGLLTISGVGAMADLDYKAPDAWLAHKDAIVSVEIKSGVTGIGSGAFYSCGALKSVTIPKGVTSIGSSAFGRCAALENVTIPEGVTSIGHDAFYECRGLKSIRIPGSVTEIDYSAFQYCTSLTEIELPSGITSIGNNTFMRCESLTSLTIPEGVTSIGKRACSSCTGLTSVTLPASLREIDSIAFYNCGSLTDVYYGGTQQQWNAITIGSSNSNLLNATIHYSSNTSGTWGDLSWTLDGSGLLTISGSGAMADLDYKAPDAWLAHKDAIVSVEIKSGVTGVGSGAFYSCGALKSVTIPKGVTSIGSSAFGRCAALESVTIPESVTSIGHDAFFNCKALTDIVIPDSVKTIDYCAFQDCSSLTKLGLPRGLKTISKYLFLHCSGLESVTIPASVTSIGRSAFSGCNSLTDVYFAGTQQQWNGITIGASNDSLKNATIHCNDGIVFNFKLPASLTTIEAEAFAGGAFSYVKLPEGATTIGSRAFADCPSLRYIYIPEATTGIAADAFSGVSGLTILGKSGSYAEFYAQRNGYAFSPAA